MRNRLLLLIFLLIISGIVGAIYFSPSLKSFIPYPKPKSLADIKSFEDCQNAGFLVVDTRPRECHTKTGQVFVEEYNGVLLQKYIVVTTPIANQVVTTPFKIEGKAIGPWYYNDQLYAKLMDDNQKIVAAKPIKALSSTTTTADFVPFVVAIDFPTPETAKGKLIIEKTNPNFTQGESGSLIIPVLFK